jgi:hypothetical protein
MMKRVVIFAHFDKHNIIDPYVISYLEELKKYSEIIFVSDGDLKQEEISKIDNLCFDNICFKHNEYDFGSYKRGFELLKTKYSEKFNKLDEVLFVNDSCYLVGSFDRVFADMKKKVGVDFWGLADDYNNFEKNNIYYIGSFFISFRKTIFLEEFFQNFISSVTKLKSHSEIVCQYEIGLNDILQRNNKKSFCRFSRQEIGSHIVKNHLSHLHIITQIITQNTNISKNLINKLLSNIFNVHTINYLHSDKFYLFLMHNFPLLKRRILGCNNFPEEKLLFLWQEILEKEKKTESIKQIKNHCGRIGFKLKDKSCIKNKFNIFLYFLHNLKPFYIKKYFKNGKEITTIKLLFFKIKINECKRFKLFGIIIWKMVRK